MNCQHDTLLPNTTMQIQSNGQASRIICLECLRAAFITKRGMFIDADPPEHAIPAPETRAHPEGSCLVGGDCDHQWLIRKRGYYYRPNRAGYTASVAEAGRYTEAEAKTEAAIEPAIMQAVRLSDVQCTCGVGDRPVRPHDRACPQAEPI